MKPKPKMLANARIDNLAELAELRDGLYGAAYAVAMREIVKDCENRPNLEAKRSVTMTVTVKPVILDSGEYVLSVTQTVATKKPPREALPVEARVRDGVNGFADVQMGSQDNAAQLALTELDETINSDDTQ